MAILTRTLILGLVLIFGLVACSGPSGTSGEIPTRFVKATGRLVCDGSPMSNVQVELWDYDGAGSDVPYDSVDDKMDETRTDAAGNFQLWAEGGDPDSGADVYLRVLYKDEIAGTGTDGRPISTTLRVLGDGQDTLTGMFRYDSSGKIDNASGDTPFQDVELTKYSGDCAVFRITREFVQDWQNMMKRPFPASAQVLRWLDLKTSPHTTYDIVKLATQYASDKDIRTRVWFEGKDPATNRIEAYGSLRYALFHELGHVIAFSLHSNNAHFADDLTRFFFGRKHGFYDHARSVGYSCNTAECAQGFAWNEGWGEFWGMRAAITTEPGKQPLAIDTRNPLPILEKYAPLVANFAAGEEWEYEGNVRERLRFMAGCLGGIDKGYRQMAEVLIKYGNQGPFYFPHTMPEFEAYAIAEHPDLAACMRDNLPFCHRQCTTDRDCGKTCPFCNADTLGDPGNRHCGGDKNYCDRGCSKDSDCGGTCPVCHTEANGDVFTSKCAAK